MGINKAPKMSDEEIAAAKAMNIAREHDLEGVKLMPMPSGCETCHTPMAQCKGLEDPSCAESNSRQ